MNIIIRNATIKDAEQIAKIKIEGWQTVYRGIIDDEFLDNMDINAEFEKRKRSIEDGALIVVAELNDEVVGYCLYRNYIKDFNEYAMVDCEISGLYIKSSLKRNGIGTKLMQHVIQEFQNHRKTKMILACLKENYPSRTFYEKMGGKYLKTEKVVLGNKEYEEVIYEYDISKM